MSVMQTLMVCEGSLMWELKLSVEKVKAVVVVVMQSQSLKGVSLQK